MHTRIILLTALSTLIAFSLGACSMINPDIAIVDAKTVTAVDENLMPVKMIATFPEGTAKVSCWFKWRNAKVNTQVLTKWHYVTDDIPILDYTFNIPKKDGSGMVALTMPGGKKLPSGSYKVDLIVNNRILKSLKFSVE